MVTYIYINIYIYKHICMIWVNICAGSCVSLVMHQVITKTSAGSLTIRPSDKTSIEYHKNNFSSKYTIKFFPVYSSQMASLCWVLCTVTFHRRSLKTLLKEKWFLKMSSAKDIVHFNQAVSMFYTSSRITSHANSCTFVACNTADIYLWWHIT